MGQLLMIGFMLTAFASGTLMHAKPVQLRKHNAGSQARLDGRAEQIRRQIAFDLHRRGSNIPPEFSATRHWSR